MPNIYFLEHGTTWKVSWDIESALEHNDGRVIKSQSIQEAALQISSITGKFTLAVQNWVVTSDFPIFNGVFSAEEYLLKGGTAAVFGRAYPTHNLSYGLEVLEEPTQSNPLSIVRFNAEARRETLAKKERLKTRRKQRKLTNLKACKSDIQNACLTLAIRCDARIVQTTNHLSFWIKIHDSVKGKRATNKLLEYLANRWKVNPGKSREYLSKWYSAEELSAIEDRLRRIVKFPKEEKHGEPTTN